MDGQDFDQWTRSLSGSISRRILVGTPLAGLLAWVAGSEVEAKGGKGKGGKGKKCDQGQTRCDKTCVDLQQNNDHCGSCGTACTTGGSRCCAGACTDTGSDRQNCGACGNLCGEGLVCSNGTCDKQCPGSQRLCAGACVNVDSDIKHCGSCDNVCAENERCKDGKCICPGPVCPKPNSAEGRCCPVAGGVCCATGLCCEAGGTCTATACKYPA